MQKLTQEVYNCVVKDTKFHGTKEEITFYILKRIRIEIDNNIKY